MRLRVTFVLLVCLTFVSPASGQKKGAFNEAATAKLLQAALDGEADDVLAALAERADPGATDTDGDPPLTLLAYPLLGGREAELVKALVAAGAKVEQPNPAGTTPLMRAAAQGRAGLVDALLAAGANVNARDSGGWSPLMYAAYNREATVARALLERGAKTDLVDENGWTPLYVALGQGAGSVAKSLIEKGTPIPAGPGPINFSPLMHAVYSRDLESVRVVLASKPDLETLDADGWTAIEVAAYNGDGQIVMELLRAGANRDFKDPEGKTALDHARLRENHEVAALLGGSWNVPQPAGGTTVKVPCPVLGGEVKVNFSTEGSHLMITTIYPKPATWYLGGGLVNRAASARTLTYEGSFAPSFHFDVDNDAKTGMKKDMLSPNATGTEYSLSGSEYGSSVTVQITKPDGEVVPRNVYNNVVDITLEKEGELVMSDDSEADPVLHNENGVLGVRVPLASVGLASDQKVRVVSEIGSCKPVSSLVTIK